MKILEKYRGFTLIELLLVMAIIGIMSAVAFVSLTSTKSAYRLKTAQREVASVIKLAQAYALQGRSQGAVTPCGYGLRFTSPTAYRIFYNPGPDCDKKNSGSDPVYLQNYLHFGASSVTAESFTLKNNVTRTAPSDANTEIYFTIPHANMYDGNGAVYGGQTFTFNFSGNTKTITVNPGGYVTEN